MMQINFWILQQPDCKLSFMFFYIWLILLSYPDKYDKIDKNTITPKCFLLYYRYSSDGDILGIDPQVFTVLRGMKTFYSKT